MADGVAKRRVQLDPTAVAQWHDALVGEAQRIGLGSRRSCRLDRLVVDAGATRQGRRARALDFGTIASAHRLHLACGLAEQRQVGVVGRLVGGLNSASALRLGMVLAAGCAQAQKAPLQWFDGQRWHTSTETQGAAQAAGGVVVMAPVAQAAALQAALVAKGLSPKPLAVAGAYELATPPGGEALLLTHRLADLPELIQAPVQVAPNWRASLRPR